MDMSYSVESRRIQKRCLRITKIRTTNLRADALHKLNNSLGFRGLGRTSVRNCVKDKLLTLPWYDPIQTNGSARFDKGQAAHPMRQSQHPQGNTSPPGCRNWFDGHR